MQSTVNGNGHSTAQARIAAGLALYGKSRLSLRLPTRTLESLRENKEWALYQLRSTKRIRETRGELDEKLGILERRAASGARVYGRVAAGVAVGVLAVVLGLVIYRRRRDRKVVNQLHEALIDARDLPADMISRLKARLPIKWW